MIVNKKSNKGDLALNIVLKCENRINPICTTKFPEFRWYFENYDGRGAFQLSYRIKVFDECENMYWDSGVVKSEDCSFVVYAGKPLLGHTKYFWNVEVETEDGVFKSEMAYFVTGLSENEWKAKWITGDFEHAPVFQKKFELSHIENPVYAFICGLGYFELYINGRRVGDDYFVPNQTDYDDVEYLNLKYPFSGKPRKRVKYLGYEVSEYLSVGENTVEIWLGNGWYKQEERSIEGTFKYGELKTIFQLHSGDFCLTSDESWLVCDGPVTYNNIYYGETFESGKKLVFSPVNLAKAPNAEFVPQLAPADKIMEEISPVRITKSIYDCGKVITGFAEIKCKGSQGGKITVRYAECLDENDELDFKSTVGYEEGDINQIQKDTFILSGDGDEVYAPHFVWHGFRYFELETENAEIIEVKAQYIYTSIEQTNSFECSDERLNEIHNIYVNSQKAAVHGAVPVDCPHRERLGYTGDGQSSSYSAMYNFDFRGFYRKWIDDILDTQNQETGFVAHTAPFTGGGGGPAWGCAVAIVPWNYYLHYGDKALLEKCLPGIEKWILYLKSRLNEKGLVYREENGSWCLGDWCVPIGTEWSEPCFDKLKLPSELVNTCFYVKCIKIYQNILEVLKIEKYDYFTEMKNATVSINREYLREFYSYGTQGCDVFPLHTGIVPEKCKEKVIKNLRENIEKNKFTFDTGIFGTGYMLDVLAENGLNDYAYKLMTQTQYPSYGYMVKNGATSVWETWEGTGSKAHGGLGCFDFWLYQELAGIKPTIKGGFKEVNISPYFCKDIGYVKAEYMTNYGKLLVSWKRKSDDIILNITVPFNITAKVLIDKDEHNVTCGTYSFCIKAN